MVLASNPKSFRMRSSAKLDEKVEEVADQKARKEEEEKKPKHPEPVKLDSALHHWIFFY
jgi:hypothetical protein